MRQLYPLYWLYLSGAGGVVSAVAAGLGSVFWRSSPAATAVLFPKTARISQKFNFFVINLIYYNVRVHEPALFIARSGGEFYFTELKKMIWRVLFFLVTVFFLLFVFCPFNAYSQSEVSISSANFSEKLQSQNFRERRKAIDYISNSSLNNKKEFLKKALTDKDPIIREKAVIALGRTKDLEAMNVLINNLKSEDRVIRISSMEGLSEFYGNNRAVSAVIRMLSHKDRNTRWKAAEALGGMKSDMGVNSLVKTALNDSDKFVRKAAVESLGKIGTIKAKAALNSLKTGSDPEVSMWAYNVLKTLK